MKAKRKALYVCDNSDEQQVLQIFMDDETEAMRRRADRFAETYERHIGPDSVRLIEVVLAPESWREIRR